MGWTLQSLIAAAGIRADVRGDAGVGGVSADSRVVAARDLFCCIPGRVADGHDHAPAAVAAGASALVVERFLDLDVPQARVDHVRGVLGPLADAFFGRPSRAMRVAGITGTNGKTTVTYLIEAMAAAAGHTPGVIGTVERRVRGEVRAATRNTPEALDLQAALAWMRDRGADVVAMEVTSEGIAQGRVDETVFACVAFTNLSQDHLNFHGTMEAYFDAKAMLFDPRFTDRAVVNVDDAYGRRLLGRDGLDTLTYGFARGDVRCASMAIQPDGTHVRLETPAGPIETTLALVGRYNVANLMCAAGIALQLGLPAGAIVSGASGVTRVPGRLERIDEGQRFTVLVDYAHTADALQHALGAASELARGRLIVVFGCGGDRDRGKPPPISEAATRLADVAIVTSDNPHSEDPLAIIEEVVVGCERGGGRYMVEPDRRAAIAFAFAEARDGDVVVIAGKGHESGQTFADRTVPFDDRDVARELLGGVHA